MWIVVAIYDMHLNVDCSLVFVDAVVVIVVVCVLYTETKVLLLLMFHEFDDTFGHDCADEENSSCFGEYVVGVMCWQIASE